MSNELLDICRRFDNNCVISPTETWIVTRAEKIDGGWELKLTKEEKETEEANDNN